MSDEFKDNLLKAAMDPGRLYHQAPCGYVTFTANGTIIRINHTLLNWLGYTAEEVTGKMKFSELLSKGGQVHYEMFFRPMLNLSGSVKELSYELLTRTGEIVHVLLGAVSVKDDDGQLLAVDCILTDNTDRKRYEQELLLARKQAEKERERLSQFFMQMPAGICVLDGPEFVFEFINPLYQQLFPGRHLLGRPLLDALPELKGQEISGILQDVYQTGRMFEGKELLVPLRRTPDSPIEDRYFNFIYQPRTNDHDIIDGVMVFVIEVTDMVYAREQVQQSERSLRTLIMTAHYALMILQGPDFVVEIANQQLAALWNKSLPEITGRKLLDILPELSDQPFPELLRNVMRTGKPYGQQEEALRLTIDNQEQLKYVSFYYDPITGEDGVVTGVIVAAEDITSQVSARKALEVSYGEQQSLNEELAAMNEELGTTNEELNLTQLNLREMIANFEESESRLRSVVESAPFPIGVYIGADMKILLANQNIIDVWGKGNDVIGRSYKEILPELENQEIFSQLDTVFKTGEPFHARNQRVDILVDGEQQIYYFNYSFTPLFDAAGNVYGVMNTAADVTDLNVAKHAVERNEKNLNEMILQAPVAMCILVGPEHVIKVANRLMVELWGKRIENVLNRPVFEALPDARNQGLEEVMAAVYNTGVAFTTSEMPVTLLRNGKEDVVYQNFVYEPFKNSEGFIIGIIAITIDVTEQVVARQRIEESEKELLTTKNRLEEELEAGKKVQRQKDGFIGMASHELKTPLTSLNAIIQVANAKLRHSPDPFLKGAMEKANLQVKRMTDLINGFLNISRLESGKMIVEKQRFNFDNLIREMIDEVQLTTNAHAIKLAACNEIEIVADRNKIGSVLSNLLSNAVKYSPKHTDIDVSCTLKGEYVMVSVKDKGMGMRLDDLEKIFDRYYRVDSADTQHIAGFGIGLYVSAEIVKQHNGRIWAESELGHGSTFYFELPL
ncbi:PAS domain-containing protein [Mucilaginibacter sp. 14171R-50]|uniref:PAS domain-containing protein n=1 Tax=Mucilaginibacter sp. 14171R-50 TaxID=2703789 RepID=UPI00138D5051|nr:PAS domain-containing protein [Mucilaginibacter sp. 14171R-50]QHS55831.1 PAS domain-containing protein [Mucilaginibacter sp. 14171R-50]